MARRKNITASLIEAGKQRLDPHDVAERMADLERRERADTRTAAQKFLGEPPPQRSALAQRPQSPTPQRASASGRRVDLWKR
jgi:hypothetical protein